MDRTASRTIFLHGQLASNLFCQVCLEARKLHGCPNHTSSKAHQAESSTPTFHCFIGPLYAATSRCNGPAEGGSPPAQAQCHFKQHRVLVNTVGEETPAVFGEHEWSDATEPARKRRYPQHRNLSHSSRKHANFPDSMNFTPMIPKGLGRTGFQLRGSEVAFAQKADLGLDSVGVAAHAHGAAMICRLPLALDLDPKVSRGLSAA